ncbi:tyrosine-type recombinase/integrase [Pseudomonas sp. SA3-5]|uniref:Tyrosine-type recombinase/integrase n=1 Tax=Pseudomonas aestuarii TaxID=3018340 RepID=A0ABT4XHG5_9PSED|nr:tyrosine-type recombinase/integrase [Pseudomonas aestuarii]MDA7087656.1 tyrosine-type recombinase/integrase [Pseudomonas aestuarii]
MRKPVTDKGDLRQMARAIVNRPLKESTIAEYRRVADRMGDLGWYEYAIDHQLTKGSAVVARYAWRREMAQRLLNVLTAIDREQDSVARRALRHEMYFYGQNLQAPQPSYEPFTANKTKKQSKRASLRGLPSDWRAQLFLGLKPADQMRAAVLILTGCRPAELRMGVYVRRDGGVFNFKIRGAKVSELTGAGQPERTLRINAEPILGKIINEHLLEIISSHGGEMTIQDANQNRAFEKRLSRAGQKIGLSDVSPYSLRHQFSADLKGEVEPDQVSLALGHVSVKSRKHYGHANQRRSTTGGVLLSVEASRELRGITSGYGRTANTLASDFLAPK